MTDENKCALGMCPEHPHTVERLAMLEKGMESVESSMRDVVDRLTVVRDQTMKEFADMKKSIINEALRRQPPWVTVGFSIIFGALCTVTTILVEHMLRD